MNRESERQDENCEREEFRAFLRTGSRIEVKFNPYHDPRDGRFTFAPGSIGGFTGGHSSSRHAPKTDADAARRRADPADPRNHELYSVKSGNTLIKIAGLRKGLRASDLAWLNGMPVEARLRIGQTIKLPHQSFLDAGRDAKNKFLALSYYLDKHDGQLPPDPAHPPSLEDQIVGPATWRRTTKNGYTFAIDPLERTRQVVGRIASNANQGRSKTSQAKAGGSDRLPADHGGHYIARRFNGPTDPFNHFAQDRSFNIGEYRKLENEWAKADREGKTVRVRITPLFEGASKRPYQITVEYDVDKKYRHVGFPNASKDK